MIVGVHQPHFLPWIGYFNKALRSNVFVWLHTVQYRKNYYQNRARIKNVDESPLWLTLPVHARLGMRIDEVTIVEPRWRDRHRKTLMQCYQKTPYFQSCWPPLEQALLASSESLDDVNFRTFLAILSLLEVKSLRVERAENLEVTVTDPTLRLVEICRFFKATGYIAGKGGRDYLRVEEFANAGIDVIWQSFDPEAVFYRQAGERFLPGLSLVDCLFNEGPARTKELLLAAWTP